ncbi:MAG: carboxylesterase/lipase family protein [Candidatus Helarchaeota archaeon]|nr:carboxylesterase/lipase family protein [Candidatus Helarchaeota archaeon]
MTNIVNTKSGKVQGYTENGLQIFKGIPFAAPPIGPLRFSPPAPRDPWSDVLDAKKFGPYALQGTNPLAMMLNWDISNQSEAECLTLNIWTPATDDKKRPVMVWIHGGGFTIGGSADPLYDGSALARRGNIVVVSINYRLGALGYLYIPGVTANAGQLDQIAALEWVRDNIESFGGDSNNVTIFGESAGGVAVATLIAMPTAKGLFHRVIAQSGACHPMLYGASMAKRISEKLMTKLKIEPGDIDALRKVPVKKIIRGQNKIGGMIGDFSRRVQSSSEEMDIMAFSPIIDGDTLPKHPLEAVRAGYASDVKLIVGTNQDEMKLFAAMNPAWRNLDSEGLDKFIQLGSGFLGQDKNKGKQLIEIYKEAREEGRLSTTPYDLLSAIFTDSFFTIGAIRLAEAYYTHQPNIYVYLFTWPSPAFDGQFGACHGLEIPFVFGMLHSPGMEVLLKGLGPAEDSLSERMLDAWIAFARSGNPNHAGLPKWPSYNVEKRPTMLFDSEIKVVDAPFRKELAAWDGIF